MRKRSFGLVKEFVLCYLVRGGFLLDVWVGGESGVEVSLLRMIEFL